MAMLNNQRVIPIISPINPYKSPLYPLKKMIFPRDSHSHWSLGMTFMSTLAPKIGWSSDRKATMKPVDGGLATWSSVTPNYHMYSISDYIIMCIYIYIYTYIQRYIYTRIDTHMYICIYTYYIYTYIYIYTYMWNHRFIRPFDCLGVITATTAVHVDTCWLKGPTYRNAGKREQPLGKRFGVNTGYLLVGREDSWKVKHSGGTFRNSLGKFISLSLPCGQGNPFRLLPVYWAHPSYTGSGASWLTLPFLREKPVIWLVIA